MISIPVDRQGSSKQVGVVAQADIGSLISIDDVADLYPEEMRRRPSRTALSFAFPIRHSSMARNTCSLHLM